MNRQTYGQIRNGDTVWIQGYRFVARNVRIETGTRDVVRFEGEALDAELRPTGYNGGTYGAFAHVPALIEREGHEVCRLCGDFKRPAQSCECQLTAAEIATGVE